MPAKGSCCCTTPDTHGLATMWILDFNYGTVVRDFNWVATTGGTPTSKGCAFDETLMQAAEVGQDHIAGAGVEGTSFLWDANTPETPIWGPLAKTPPTRATGGFSPSYFWYGQADIRNAAFNLAAAARSDGSDYTHGMTGGLLRTDGTHIYTYTDSTPTHRKYAEDGTLVASNTVTGIATDSIEGLSFSGNGEHYHSNNVAGTRNYEAVNPTTLATAWTLALASASGSAVEGNDEDGGMYLVVGGNILKYSAGSLVYSATEPTGFGAATNRFGSGGNLYYIRSITGTPNLTKIDGSDGSIAWNAVIPFTPTSLHIEQQSIVYEGIVYVPYATGIWAIDDATGSTLWDNDTQVCGYSRPVPTSLGLLCCGEYS